MKTKFLFALRADLSEEKQFLPTKATPGSVGWDVRCATEDRRPLHVRPGKYVKIPLGIQTIPPDGWWLQMKPRSSSFVKKSLHCLYGTIDEDFRGQLFLCAYYMPDISALGTDLVLEFGEAVGQLIPMERHEMVVSEISLSEFTRLCASENNLRGTGGFGSTGK